MADVSKIDIDGVQWDIKDSYIRNYVTPTNSVLKQYIREQNELDEMEDITLSTSSNNPTVMQYDGFLIVGYSYGGNVYVNNKAYNLGTNQPSGVYSVQNANTIPIKKGDLVYKSTSANLHVSRVIYYKKRDYTDR